MSIRLFKLYTGTSMIFTLLSNDIQSRLSRMKLTVCNLRKTKKSFYTKFVIILSTNKNILIHFSHILLNKKITANININTILRS